MTTQKYYITDDDKKELNKYAGTNTLDDEFYNILAKLLKKNKWSVFDLRILNQMIDDGLGYLLYQLFEEKAQHSLFMKYYQNDDRLHPPRGNLQDLIKIAEDLKQGLITIDDLPSMGVRIRSTDELISGNQRIEDNIKFKSEINDKLGKQISVSNKKNTYKAK
jgi:hypothetical protein